MTNSLQQSQLFLFGGLSCQVAALVTNPIDVIKIRLQIQGELTNNSSQKLNGLFQTTKNIIVNEGVKGLYKGLGASLLREGTYSTIRMGGYDLIKDKYFQAQTVGDLNIWKKFVAGAISGMIGAAIATPTDLVKVRMQAPPQSTTPRYRHCFHGFYHIYKNEGIIGLYKGIGPTTQRAILLTATQLACYDHIKHAILHYGLKEGALLHLCASTLAGFFAALATSPVDLIKTRVMNQQIIKGQPLVYKNSFDCLVKTVSKEGFLALYKGFFPNWIRIGPHTVVTFLVNEWLRKISGIRPV